MYSCSPHIRKRLIDRNANNKSIFMPKFASREVTKYVIGIVLVLALLYTPLGLSVLTTQRIIVTSGTISSLSILPLHTDGAYVKDSLNHIVYLRGVNIPSGFTASCTGAWYHNGEWIWGVGYTTFDQTGLTQRLQEVKNFGMNTIRLIFNTGWMQTDAATNLNGQTTNIHIREAMRRSIEAAAQNGIYIILGGPYPVGNVLADFNNNPAQFASFWGTMAQLYGSYPNVIFDLWGETVDDYSSWMSATQQAVVSIRSYSQNLIAVQYGYCGGFGFVDDIAPTIQSYGNIVYSNHIYRYPPGATFTTSETTTAQVESKLRNSWSYGSVIGKYPMYIGEIGAWIDYGSGETTWFTNTLALLNSWGAGYSAWEWGQLGTGWQLQNDAGAAPYTLNTNGQVLVNSIAAGS